MMRSIACFSVSCSLWLAMARDAAGQAVVENGLGAARAATTTAPAKGVGKSISGLTGSLDKALKAGQQGSDGQPAAVTTAKPATKGPSSSGNASPKPALNWEDPSGIEPGLSYEEFVRRFGPPSMAITVAAERSLTYRGKDGVFRVKVQGELVTSIEKPQP